MLSALKKRQGCLSGTQLRIEHDFKIPYKYKTWLVFCKYFDQAHCWFDWPDVVVRFYILNALWFLILDV